MFDSKVYPLQELMHIFLFMKQQKCSGNLTFCSLITASKVNLLQYRIIYIVVLSTFLEYISLLLAGGSIKAINVCSHCISNIVCCCCSSSFLAIPKFIFLDKSLYLSLKKFYLQARPKSRKLSQHNYVLLFLIKKNIYRLFETWLQFHKSIKSNPLQFKL